MNPSLYHMTHGKNLAAILREGGLWSHNQLVAKGLTHQDASNPRIQNNRARKQVPLPPGGCLHDYVPFYFCPRSPMLGAIKTGSGVPQIPQNQMLYLVTDVDCMRSLETVFVFTDGHAGMELSDFYQDPCELNRLDWNAIGTNQWGGEERRDLRRRKEAEFLVHRFVPFALISSIGVYDSTVKKRVEAILQAANVHCKVSLHSDWYF